MYTQSDQSLSFPPEETLDPWLPIECPLKTRIRLCRFDGRTCQLVLLAGHRLNYDFITTSIYQENMIACTSFDSLLYFISF